MRQPPHIVTTRPDGTRDYWTRDHSVTPRDVHEIADLGDEHQWTGCEWMCESAYRRSVCGRGAYRNLYGLSLCWQHEDAAFRHVYNQIVEGRSHKAQNDDLAAVLLKVGGLETVDGMGGSPIDRLVRAEIRRYMQEVIDRGESPNYEFGLQLDELISQRIQQKWGV